VSHVGSPTSTLGNVPTAQAHSHLQAMWGDTLWANSQRRSWGAVVSASIRTLYTLQSLGNQFQRSANCPRMPALSKNACTPKNEECQYSYSPRMPVLSAYTKQGERTTDGGRFYARHAPGRGCSELSRGRTRRRSRPARCKDRVSLTFHLSAWHSLLINETPLVLQKATT